MTEKSTVMRILDAHAIPYIVHEAGHGEVLSAEDVAAALGRDPYTIFKTLVTVAGSGKHYVFMLPAPATLDLKKAAAVAGEKSIAMIKAKELLPLTGYVHGGCSPVGMKKLFPTFIDELALLSESIIFNGGRVGLQLETTLTDLQKVVAVTPADLSV